MSGVTKSTRFEVLRRDGHRCRYCGASPADGAVLHVDHVVPKALGGTDDPGNLVTACEPCNAGKGSSSPDTSHVSDVSSLKLRWAEAMAQAAEEARADRKRVHEAVVYVDATWCAWKMPDGRPPSRPATWAASIEGFLSCGMSDQDLVDLVEDAMTPNNVRDRWRYFCGIVWRHIQKRQERALEILAEQERWPCPRHPGRDSEECQECQSEAVPPPPEWAGLVEQAVTTMRLGEV